MLQFGDIEPFLTRNVDLGPTLRPKLLKIITDVNSRSHLQMELAAVIDVGEHFVKATYNLGLNTSKINLVMTLHLHSMLLKLPGYFLPPRLMTFNCQLLM